MISLRLRRGDVTEEPTGGLLSYTDWARRDIKWLFGSTQALLLVLLVLIGLGPVVWLAKGAVTPTIDTLRNPLALFPHGVAWSNLTDAWTKVNVDTRRASSRSAASGSPTTESSGDCAMRTTA